MRFTSCMVGIVLSAGCNPPPPEVHELGRARELSSPAPSETLEEVSEVGAPKPVALPEPPAHRPSEPVTEPAGKGERSDGERIEERWPDGKPKLSRTIRRDGDGIVNHGPFSKWYPNGVIAEEGRYVDGEKDGLYVMRWDTGFDKSRIEYRRGVQNGRAQRWNEDGVLLYDATFVDGQPDGVEHEWWPNQGPRSESSYVVGVPDGSWKKWHGKGVVAEEGSFEKGKRVGTWTYRYPTGSLQRIEQYEQGRLHGHVIEYDENEHVLSDGEYVEGVAEGVHLEFHASGKKKSETHFSKGKPEGKATRWYEDGQVEAEGEMRAGAREGKWTFWNADGTIDTKSSGTYAGGQRVAGA